MCEQAEALKCRSRQLHDAAEKVIDLARKAGNLPAAVSFVEIAESLHRLNQAVAVFDRLNRGL